MAGTNFARDQLKSLIERVERLEVEKRALTADIGEVYHEAKGHGFDVKIMRKVVKIRGVDPVTRATEEEMIDLYLSAVGDKPEKDEARRPGGHARAAALSPERRREIASKAAAARWNASTPEPPHDAETGEVIEVEQAAPTVEVIECGGEAPPVVVFTDPHGRVGSDEDEMAMRFKADSERLEAERAAVADLKADPLEIPDFLKRPRVVEMAE